MNDKNLIKTLIENLNNGETTFSYRKSDGSTRSAKGTTKIDLIPVAARPATVQTVTESSPAISYYDLDANGWRSFRSDQVISA